MLAATYDELKHRALTLFMTASSLAQQAGAGVAVERLDAAERPLRDERFTLVVMGEFGHGKSSLLNAYLREPGLFPVHSYVSTRLVTTARFGPEETVVVSLAERPGRPAEERHIARTEIAAYASETHVTDGAASPDADRATAISVTLPNPVLAQGLVVVDTPGIGGVHRGHTAAAVGVLSSADAVLYVIDAQQEVPASGIAFIEDAARALDVRGCPARLVFAVTKTDRVEDPDTVVDELRSRLQAVPGFDADGIVIVGVSSRHRLLHLQDGEPERLELSNFGELERQLRTSVTLSRARLRLSTALNELDSVTRTLLAPAEHALAVLDAEDEAERERLVAAARQHRAKAADRTATDAWKSALEAELEALNADLCTHATSVLAELWRGVRESYRARPELLDDPQLVLDQLARRLALLIADLGERARAGTTEIHARAADRIGLASSPLTPASLPALPPLPDPSTLARPDGDDSAEFLVKALAASVEGARTGALIGERVGDIVFSQALGRALPQGPIGGAAQGVMAYGSALLKDDARPGSWPGVSPGALIGARIGAAVGATVAFAGRLRLERKKDVTDRVHTLDRALASCEEEQRTFLHESLGEIVGACARTAAVGMERLAARQQAEHEATLAEIETALAAVGQDAVRNRQELTDRRANLHALRISIAEVADATGALQG
ncbi:dynamin family protein [Streptomyces sp. NPDC058678]|uniref:dynamin family protein n=1 Tax=Streptomyces sp. NPDC058678 TaxID=3346595 RepID=UPI00366A2A47